MLEVAEHYQHFGGVSPINDQNRDMMRRLELALDQRGLSLPIYWGNRNWKPYIKDALKQIRQDGRRLALPIFTNMFSCYSGCRQYRENIADSLDELAEQAPTVAPRLRFGFNHPRFVSAQTDLTRAAIERLDPEQRQQARILFAAHSIPLSMSENCQYVNQLTESARLVTQGLVAQEMEAIPWELVYQSRSGPPQQPWAGAGHL
jgi:protoporphyrin/coproporphyrin ferrochelatase